MSKMTYANFLRNKDKRPLKFTFFFLHFSGGAELKTSGLQAESCIKIGYSLIDNLALHATLNLSQMYGDLEAYVDGDKEYSLSHDGFDTFILGLGATFYIPNTDNFFASASFGISDYTVTFDEDSYSFDNLDTGFGLNFMVGKERTNKTLLSKSQNSIS